MKWKTDNPVGRPTEFTGVWYEMQIAAGGVAHLAAVMRVSVRSLQRWAAGDSRPSDDNMALVNAAARKLGVRSPYEAHAPAGRRQ